MENLGFQANTVDGLERNIPPKNQINRLVVLSSFVASIGGILFGYDIGIISGAMLQLRIQFSLSPTQQDLVTSSVLLGAFLASLFSGSIVDHIGRRLSIFLTGLLFVTGTVLLAFSYNLTMLIIGRLIVGFGVALSTTAECTYISEIAPSRWRGLCVSLNEFGITIGFLLAYVSSYLLISYPSGWRIMFGVAALPAFCQLVGVAFLPASPYYLVLKGNLKLAEETLARLDGQNIDAKVSIEKIKSAIIESKSSSFRDLFGKNDSMRYRLMVGLVLVLLQQFTGNANILYYAPIIFQKFGFSSEKLSTLVSITFGFVKVVTSAIALALVDRFGRLRFLCTGASVMGVSLLTLGIVSLAMETKLENISANFNTSEVVAYKNESTPDDELVPISMPIKVVSVVSLMGFICGYQFSFGICTWLVLSEIYPTAVRGRGVSMATTVNWAANLIITVTFMQSIEAIGIEKMFIIYSCACFVAAIFIYIFVPETKQKSLEEISNLMNKGPDLSCLGALRRRKTIYSFRNSDCRSSLIDQHVFYTTLSSQRIGH